jgi:hypothetical protein
MKRTTATQRSLRVPASSRASASRSSIAAHITTGATALDRLGVAMMHRLGYI